MSDQSALRVLYVSPGSDARGGAERSLLGLLDGLDRQVIVPSAIVLGEGSMVDALRSRRIATTALELRFRGGASYGDLTGRLVASSIAARSLADAASAVRNAVNDTSADIVHSNGMRGHVLLPLLRSSGVATVASIRELPRSQFEAFPLRWALRSADAVIATSGFVKRQLSFASNVEVVDNPIEMPALPDREQARHDFALPPGAFVVAMLAHFHWWKGHLDLLRAVETLDDVWVIAAGGDLYGSASTSYRQEVLDYAKSRGFAHRVRCVDALADVGPVYAAADVVAHCSVRPEPFGRTLVEAMLAEKPVVASSAGAPGEFVSHAKTGLLFAPGDVDALRTNIVALRDQPELRKSLARTALIDIADRFDPRRHAARMTDIYATVANARGHRSSVPDQSTAAVRLSPTLPWPVGERQNLRRWSPIGKELGPTLENRFAGRVVSHLGILSAGHRGRAQALDAALNGIPEPRLVFDIGCGRGGNAFLLARRYPQASIIGIDVDREPLSVAERAAAEAGLRNVRFEPTPPDHIDETRQADLVVCIDVLEHVVDDEHFANEVLRRVAPGGTLIIHVPLRDQHYHFSTVRRITIRAIEEGRDPHVREGYRDSDIRRLFASHFRDFSTRQTLGGLMSVIADLEALSYLTHKRLPRLLGVSLLPLGGHAGGRWSKGLLAVGLHRGKETERDPRQDDSRRLATAD